MEKGLCIMLLCTMLFCGCASNRSSYVVQMQYRRPLALRNQYNLVNFIDLNYDEEYYKPFYGTRVMNLQKPALEGIAVELRKLLPANFSSKGIPIMIRKTNFDYVEESMMVCLSRLSCMLLSICSYFVIPYLEKHDYKLSYDVQLLDNDARGEAFDIVFTKETLGSWWPHALLFYNGPPTTSEDKPCFYTSWKNNDELKCPESSGPFGHLRIGFERNAYKAIAYAVAVKLMEIEASDARAGIARSNESLYERYRVKECKRTIGNDFEYAFIIELTDTSDDVLRTFKDIQEDFRSKIRREYIKSHINVKPHSLVVEFADYSIKDRDIKGRAIVLDLRPMSCSYNGITRRGKVSIRFGAGQFEAARRYARRHIEDVARNSNIEHTEGDALPEGRYYSLGERIVGNDVLEIDFKTE